ncbi:hypothetical protein [Kordiimonas sp. SCSIO 12610]|uniref:DUF7878 domain-containing protein n=1 Tax=Kordiimonas sp. SCSIO 12610 TaxID=2829597 RepID=UPI00210A4B79|nr:hypothetical protein [Kordiimonas sp. SCSIO 12610]UTW56122.1 hypothetical protein KFF44_04295 [Kordiimonas sp. SCSIO 12610]
MHTFYYPLKTLALMCLGSLLFVVSGGGFIHDSIVILQGVQENTWLMSSTKSFSIFSLVFLCIIGLSSTAFFGSCLYIGAIEYLIKRVPALKISKDGIFIGTLIGEKWIQWSEVEDLYIYEQDTPNHGWLYKKLFPNRSGETFLSVTPSVPRRSMPFFIKFRRAEVGLKRLDATLEEISAAIELYAPEHIAPNRRFMDKGAILPVGKTIAAEYKPNSSDAFPKNFVPGKIMRFGFALQTVSTSNEALKFIINNEAIIQLVNRDGNVVFEEVLMLPVELAVCAKKWLNGNREADFYYESMDEEEHPVLAFERSGDLYNFRSVWPHEPYDNISRHEIEECLQAFIDEVKNEFSERGVKIPTELDL